MSRVVVDTKRIEAAISEILAAIGEDPARPGLVSTPRRVAASYAEFFSGVGADETEPLRDSIPVDRPGDVVLLRDVAFRSMCEHHLLPFVGVAHVAYLPGERVVGLGQLPRAIDIVASRPQVQERLTEQIADAVQSAVEPRGVLVVVDAHHECVSARDLGRAHSSTVTLASRGELADPVARGEIMALIGARGE